LVEEVGLLAEFEVSMRRAEASLDEALAESGCLDLGMGEAGSGG
jgi:hypothetical protein